MMDIVSHPIENHDAPHVHAPTLGQTFNILSWNLLRRSGATIDELVALMRTQKPDIVLMQEATADIDALPRLIPGHYTRLPLPGRTHGTACWSRFPFTRPPVSCQLPAGLIVKRTAQIIDFGTFSVANVHLSHGQILNRRQLRTIAAILRPRALIMGDFNLVGPTMLPGFDDVGARLPTHRMADLVPIRIDRCLIRGLTRLGADVLPNASSDHHPIAAQLRLAHSAAPSWRERFRLPQKKTA